MRMSCSVTKEREVEVDLESCSVTKEKEVEEDLERKRRLEGCS